MFCSKCGNQLDEGVAFCPKCGAKVGETKENTKTKEKGFFCKKILPLILLVVLAGSLFINISLISPYTIHHKNDSYFGNMSCNASFFDACSWNEQGYFFRDLFLLFLALSIIVYVVRLLKKEETVSPIPFISKNLSLISFIIALVSLVSFIACSLSLFTVEIVQSNGASRTFTPYYFFYVIILVLLYTTYIPFIELYGKKSVAER